MDPADGDESTGSDLDDTENPPIDDAGNPPFGDAGGPPVNDAESSLFDNAESPPFDNMFETTTEEQIETAAVKAIVDAYVDKDAAAARLLQANIERREQEEGAQARKRKLSETGADVEEKKQLEKDEGVDSLAQTYAEKVALLEQKRAGLEEVLLRLEQEAEPITVTPPQPSYADETLEFLSQERRRAKEHKQESRPVLDPRLPAYDCQTRMMRERRRRELIAEIGYDEREEARKAEIRRHRETEEAEAKRVEAERGRKHKRGGRRGNRRVATRPPPSPRPANLTLVLTTSDWKSAFESSAGASAPSIFELQPPPTPRPANRTLEPTESTSKSASSAGSSSSSEPEPQAPANVDTRDGPADNPLPRWRTPGRQRGKLNLDMKRIQTDFILADHFIDDINVMLDFVRNWSYDDFKPIYASFKNAPENVGRTISCSRTFKGMDQWDWNVQMKNPTPYVPPKPVYVDNDEDEEPIQNSRLPLSCARSGCTPGCPHSKTQTDTKRSQDNALDVQRSHLEEAIRNLEMIASARKAVAKTRETLIIDKMRMPPPFSMALPTAKIRPTVSRRPALRTSLLLEGIPTSTKSPSQPLNAANLSKVPDVSKLPPPDSPLWRSGLLPNEDEGFSQKGSPSPPPAPEKPKPKPNPTRQRSAYIIAPRRPRDRRSFFSRVIPRSVTQRMPQTAPAVESAPGASPEATNSDKNTQSSLFGPFNSTRKPRKPPKEHPRVESWQEAAKCPIKYILLKRTKYRHNPWFKTTSSLFTVRQDGLHPSTRNPARRLADPDYYLAREDPEDSLRQYTTWNSLKAIFEGPGSVPGRRELGEAEMRALERAPALGVGALEDAPVPVVRSLDEASIVVDQDPPALVTEILDEMSSSDEEDEMRGVKRRKDSSRMSGEGEPDVKKQRK